MPVVTISRQFGAGGHTLGETLARHLGYQLVDRELCHKVAEEACVSVDWVESIEQSGGDLLMRICSRLVSGDFIERIIGPDKRDFDDKKYLDFVTKIIKKLASEDDVVIVGRGAQFILPDADNIIKILLVAELSDRIKFMMEHYDLTKAKAEQLVQKEEKKRATFLKMFDSRDPDDPSNYTMVINTSKITLAEAETLVVSLIGRLLDQRARPIW